MVRHRRGAGGLRAADAALLRPGAPRHHRGRGRGGCRAADRAGRGLAGAERLRERLADGLGAERAATTWAWYRNASFMACPVRTAAGSTLGVLVISTHPPAPPLRRKDLRTVEAFASLAALALERSQLLDAQARRTREEKLLNAAWHAVAASLDLDVVYRAIVAQARALTDADRILLARFDLAAEELRGVASHGLAGPAGRVRFRLGEGMAGRAAQTGVPAVSCASDSGWVIEGEPAGSSLHVPIILAGRLFGVPRRGARGARPPRGRRPAAPGRACPRGRRRDRQRARLPARAPHGGRHDARLRAGPARRAARARAGAGLRARRPPGRRRRPVRRLDPAARRRRGAAWAT